MKVLIVDDESYVMESIERFISRLGHIPTTAGNGAKAIASYKEHRPDIVLLDILLPDIKGDVVFKEIFDFDDKANIYFITGCQTEFEKVKELPAKGFFMKPVELGTIKKIIDDAKPKN